MCSYDQLPLSLDRAWSRLAGDLAALDDAPAPDDLDQAVPFDPPDDDASR